MKLLMFVAALSLALAVSGAAEAKGHKGHKGHHGHMGHHGGGFHAGGHGRGKFIKGPKIYCAGLNGNCIKQ
jgi:hypothetical protein